MPRFIIKIITFFIALQFLPSFVEADPQPQLAVSCEQSAREALQRINKVSMEKRASLVWRELSQTAIHCDHPDPGLMDMAQKASKLTGVKREWELGLALRESPLFNKICSSGIRALDEAMALVPKDQIDFLVKNCPIKDPVGYGAKRDLGLITFLYAQSLSNEWRKNGLSGNSHQIILNTLLLASAQERGAIDDVIDHLANPVPLAKKRDDIEKEIKGYGLEAVPALINRLDDQTSAGETTATPPGQCLNLPPLGSEDLPDECRHMKLGRQTTMGQRCENLLYAIITPPGDLTLEQGRILWKSQIDRSFVIKDWARWWGKNQGKSLEELRAKARDLENQFWKRGWDKGPVEWK